MSIKVGNYLFTRLKQLGISTVFGVPGGMYCPAQSTHIPSLDIWP
jgi:TPP-dependent 2-oxoacid decarboxylase